MQVITPENHVEFIQTGKVADFKPPEPPKNEATPDAKTTDATTTPTTGAQAEAKTDAGAKSKDEPKRDAEGKFVKAGETPAGADGDAIDDVKLTEKITRLINKKHREMREAQEFATGEGRRAIAAEQRAEQLRREIDALRSGKSDGPKAGEGEGRDPNKPKQADFKTVGDFTEALVEYEAKKAGKQAQAQAESNRQQAQANAVIGSFIERQDAFRAVTPDYDEVVGGTEVELHNVGMQYLLESEVGPQLGYYLAKPENREEVARLKKLSPTRLVAELGKLETKFEQKQEAPNKAADAEVKTEVSKAPAPISPLKGEAAPVQKDPSQMTLQELRAFREQERRAKAAR